jgi:predicted nucleotidyltransferase
MSELDELKRVAATLANWAAAVPTITIYFYGSRVRGDHRNDSDVDVSIEFTGTDDEVDWWRRNNETDFSEINLRLPGPLQILDESDPLVNSIRSARRVYQDRNVVCVWKLPKSSII